MGPKLFGLEHIIYIVVSTIIGVSFAYCLFFITDDIPKIRESINKNLKTGEIEVIVSELEVYSMAHDIPFEISNDTTALEDTRLKYRYLDLRRENIKNNIITRHKIVTSIREYLNNIDFIEIETPILCKSTPEGARDFLVPSRVSKGSCYALPQSPQMYCVNSGVSPSAGPSSSAPPL